MTMTDAEARKRTVLALERIAAALERTNNLDPLAALERALGENQGALVRDAMNGAVEGVSFGKSSKLTLDDASSPDLPPGVSPSDAWRFR